MKELLKEFAQYNSWANQCFFKSILALPGEKQKKEVPSSFSSLYQTIVHMWNAESIWWQRMKLQERIIVPGDTPNLSMEDAISGLQQQDRLWEHWISQATLAALEHVFQYQNNRKEQFKQPVYQMILHVLNHNTYHRGQLVNILRQLGEEKIPQTDFIIWSRKK